MAIDILKHFVPVVYPVGHMGNFLLNFLAPVSFLRSRRSKSNLTVSYSTPMNNNYEWEFNDAFESFFGKPLHTSSYALTILPDYFEYNPNKEGILEICKTILKVKYNMVLNNIPLGMGNVKNYYDKYCNSDQYPTDEFIVDNSTKYLKAHTGFQHHEMMPFENRIVASFPEEKFMIPYSLLLYKMYNRPGAANRIEELNSMVELGTLRNECSMKFDCSLTPNCKHIDMYRLVIEKDISQVCEISSDFEFNNEKRAMLDQAYNSTMSILNKFNVDPNHITLDPSLPQEFRDIENVDNLLSIVKG
jgi:hypothetical protein